MSIARRFGLASACLVFLSITATVVLVGVRLEDSLLPVATRSMHRRTDRLAAMLTQHLDTAKAEIVELRSSPLVAELLASASPDDTVETRLTAHLVSVVASHPAILQLRVLDHPTGDERIRVERSPRGPPRVVPREDLQAKAHRPYFQRAAALEGDEIFVSKIELNQEHRRIEVPHRPTLRIAGPVEADGGARAVLVLNLDMTNIFAEMTAASAEGAVYLIDARGDFLLHPDGARTFATELGHEHRAEEELPFLTAALTSQAPQTIQLDEIVYATRPWKRNAERLVFVESTPLSDLRGPIDRAVQAVWVVGLVTVLVGLLLSAFIARTLTQPLGQLTSAVAALESSEGGPGPSLPKHGGPDVITLANAFETMRTTIHDRNARLAKQTAQFRLVVDRSPNGKLVTTRDGTIVHTNPAALAIFGAKDDDLIGASVHTFLPDIQDADPEVGPDAGSERCLGRHRDGHEIPLQVVRTRLAAETEWYTLISVVDVTEIERSAAWFARIIEATPNPMVIVDREGVITLTNQAADDLFAYDEGELLGQHVNGLVPTHVRGEHADHIRSFNASPSKRPMGKGRELRAVRRDGSEVTVEVGLTPIDGPSGLSTIASITDLTERITREQELERSNAELAQFAYVASHDLQEPLRMVANYSQLLARRYEGQLDERADKYIRYAVDGTRRMQALVHALLEYSRVGSQGRPFEAVDLGVLMERVVRSFASTLHTTGGEVTYDELPTVDGDPVQLAQLFQNLIQNALKFHGEAPPRVCIEARAEGSAWRVAVIDHGIGIDPEQAERVFQMFQRLHPIGTYEGSGMGLAITKRIVERHGGRVWFEATPGGGTTFFVTLQSAEVSA